MPGLLAWAKRYQAAFRVYYDCDNMKKMGIMYLTLRVFLIYLCLDLFVSTFVLTFMIVSVRGMESSSVLVPQRDKFLTCIRYISKFISDIQ